MAENPTEIYDDFKAPQFFDFSNGLYAEHDDTISADDFFGEFQVYYLIMAKTTKLCTFNINVAQTKFYRTNFKTGALLINTYTH